MSNFEEQYELIVDVRTCDYSWSAVGLFRQKETGRVYYATDGGCSCNYAWADTTEANLTPLTRDNMQEVIRSAQNVDASVSEVADFIKQMEGALHLDTEQ